MKPYIEAGQKIELIVYRHSGKPSFDRACEEAYYQALGRFGVDDCGHLHNIIGGCRSTDTVVVEFVRYRHYGGVGGQSCEYYFEAWVDRAKEEDDE